MKTPSRRRGLEYAIDATAPSLPRHNGPDAVRNGSKIEIRPPATSSHGVEDTDTHEQEVRRLQIAVHDAFLVDRLYRFEHLLPGQAREVALDVALFVPCAREYGGEVRLAGLHDHVYTTRLLLDICREEPYYSWFSC